MAIVTYSKRMMLERLKKHLNDGFPGEDFNITQNELLMYLDASIPFVMKAHVFENAKITGVLDIPEAYVLTYELTISTQNASTKEWYVTLPQTPLELPAGYDITNVYVTDPQFGRSDNALPISNKRVAFRDYMPRPTGFYFRLEGQKMYLKASDGASLYNYTLNVQMPISRTDDLDDPMNLPDGALEPLFQKTIDTILQRYQIPQDIVKDNLPAGVKTS
jgi:hypothetical protein